MAEIDWPKFAAAARVALKKRDVSYDGLVAVFPDLNKGLLSRACNGMPLSAGNFLRLCRVLWLKPDRFLIVVKRRRVTLKDILKHQQKQAVTVPVNRETRA